MKVLASLGLTVACLIASPALAGPAGTGLTFTEEVAKKTLQTRAAKAQTAAACTASAEAAAKPAEAAIKEPACRAS